MPVIVVGAGAAGLTAAIFAARSGVPVVVVETRPKPGAKIRVSGGGRCNILPSKVELEDFHTTGSHHTMRNLLFSWPLGEVRAFFEDELGIPLKVEASGKLFPRSNRSRDVVDALLRELQRSGARLVAPFRVASLERTGDGSFTVTSSDGERLGGRALVLATGGLSLPKTGSDGKGMQFAIELGHRCVPTYPALVPLRSRDLEPRTLSGVSVRVRVTVESDGRRLAEREGDLLFTHRGFSGPIVLDLSHFVTRGDRNVSLRVCWGGGEAGAWSRALLAQGRATVGSVLRRKLPDRLADLLVDRAGVESSCKLSELGRESRLRLVDELERFVLSVNGSEGYATAEVTGGGVPLDEVAPATLESRIVPGLHLCGEILDATGRLGGYNFLWAWVTGRKVGRALASGGARPAGLRVTD